MNEDHRKVAVRWFEEIWNHPRRETIAELLGPDSVLHDGPDTMRGPEGFYPFYDRLRATFPDLHVTVEDTLVEGDKVCVRWSSRMTHTGDGLGMPATGKSCRVTGMSLARVENGRIAEAWQNWDMLGLLHQLQESPGPRPV